MQTSRGRLFFKTKGGARNRQGRKYCSNLNLCANITDARSASGSSGSMTRGSKRDTHFHLRASVQRQGKQCPWTTMGFFAKSKCCQKWRVILSDPAYSGHKVTETELASKLPHTHTQTQTQTQNTNRIVYSIVNLGLFQPYLRTLERRIS